MAALQTLRKKPALLMSVIGGALLLFIITMVLENQSGIMGPDMEAGEVYGEEVTIQDFESKVSQEQNFQEIARVLGGYFQTGQLNPQRLSEAEKDQIRQQTWNDILTTHAVKAEAEELGLEATEGDVKNALMGSQYQETQFMMMVGSFVSGTPTIDGYKQFMAGFDKQLAQIRQQQPELEDLFLNIHRASLYAEQKLQDAILLNKYASFMRHSFTANAISAQMEVNDHNTTASIELAAVPYTTIADSAVTVDDKDLKAKYKEYKNMFFTPSETRMVKLIDVNVTPSLSDRANLMQEVKAKETALREATNADEVATIVGDSKSTVSYNNAYFPKDAYTQGRLNEVANAIDTMSVGQVKAAQNDGQFITTFKLVAKVNTADSLLIRGIGAKDKAQADSIMGAIKAGSDFGEVAVSLGQKDTTFWIENPIYVERPAKADSGVYTNLCQLNVKEAGIIAEQQNFAVMEVLEKAHNTTKYNVAVVKYPIEFSDETYENALSKLNNFLANNKTIEDFTANASKEGYYIQDIPNFSSESYMSIRRIGGDQATQAVRWILDDAEAGDISNVFECGTDKGTHLLAAAVVSVSDEDYLPLENESVKEFITSLVKQDKKAEMIKANLKDVKTFADAKIAKGAIADSVSQFTLDQFPQMPFIGVVEPTLAGAMAKANKGDFVNAIQGGAAVYMMQVVDKTTAAGGNLDETMMNIKGSQLGNVFGMTQGMYGQQSLNQYPMRLINDLIQHEGNIVDKRYKF